MPNLRGAGPVGRDNGDLLYATRIVNRVLRVDVFGLSGSTAILNGQVGHA